MEDFYKEVRYDLYCKKCKYYEKSVFEDPCNECLDEPCNINTHRPIKFEEKE